MSGTCRYSITMAIVEKAHFVCIVPLNLSAAGTATRRELCLYLVQFYAFHCDNTVLFPLS